MMYVGHKKVGGAYSNKTASHTTLLFLALLSFATFFTACSKDEQQSETPIGKDLTVLFAWESGFSGAGYDDAILKSVSESQAAHPDMTVHLIRPKSQAEALALVNDFTAKNGNAEKALILCGPQYESLAQRIQPGAGRILLVDSEKELSGGLSTLQLKRYGGAWLAGALSKGLKLHIIKAFDGDRMMDTVADGIEDGYRDAGGQESFRIVLSDSYRGTNMPDELFNLLYMNPTDYFDADGVCLVPVCGASRMGAYSFSNNYFVLSLGIGEDCSVFSDILPYSLIYDMGEIIKTYINQWIAGQSWPTHKDFGLSTGHVRIQYNDRFFVLGSQRGFLKDDKELLTKDEYKALEAQYIETAKEKEVTHAY